MFTRKQKQSVFLSIRKGVLLVRKFPITIPTIGLYNLYYVN